MAGIPNCLGCGFSTCSVTLRELVGEGGRLLRLRQFNAAPFPSKATTSIRGKSSD
jgi:hypothetical protein